MIACQSLNPLSRYACFVLFSWGTLIAGCSPSNPRQEVSGNISLSGSPLNEGIIEFQPLSNTDPELPSTKGGAVIADGKYMIPSDYGLVPGIYRVLISSGDGVTPDDPEGIPGPSGNFVSKDRIPPEFNRNSTVEIEVIAGSPNVFDFAIP